MTLLGATTIAVGVLLLSGASIGALLRGSSAAVAASAARRSAGSSGPRRPRPVPAVAAAAPASRPLCASLRRSTSHVTTRMWSARPAGNRPASAARRPGRRTSRRRSSRPGRPDGARVLASRPHRARRSDPAAAVSEESGALVAEQLVQTLAALRRRRERHRPDLGAARHALRAPARAWDEGLEGRRPEGRPLVRAGNDRDPHPRADPRQAGGRRRAPELLAQLRPPRRRLRRPAADGQPARGLAREGHLRRAGLDRPGADAAPADRRHDRVGQVGLHQHDPDLDPAALDARRRAPDPDRPEAHRAQPLRGHPASAHPRGVEPEGGGRRPAQRGGGDGAALRAAVGRARAEPARGEPVAAAARRGDDAVPPRRDRRARRPDDDLAAGRGGLRHPARAEVARCRHPPRPRHPAPVGRRDHRA